MENINVNLTKDKQQFCECGSELFIIANKAFRLSALESPNGQETLIPIQVLICVTCGKELK